MVRPGPVPYNEPSYIDGIWLGLTSAGEPDFPEEELTHLDGHKGSKPVRIGNGAIDHVQLVSLPCLILPGANPEVLLFRTSTESCKPESNRCIGLSDMKHDRMDCIYLGQKYGRPLVRLTTFSEPSDSHYRA